MSDYRRQQGKLLYIDTFISEDQIDNYLIDYYTENDEFQKLKKKYPFYRITNYLYDTYELEFIITKDLKLFQIVEINDIESEDSWCTINKMTSALYSFDTQYYDGGTCYQEMLEDKLNELEL